MAGASKSRGPKRRENLIRVVVPDSHGAHIDKVAANAFLADLRRLDPDEIVMLGDHLDCGGVFSSHARSYTNELTESYEADCAKANELLDCIQANAPRATAHYLAGNHEMRVEAWASRNFQSAADARRAVDALGPAAVLRLKSRGIPYYTRGEHYMGLSIPGTIRLGKCFYTHGITHAKNAAMVHLERFGASVVFGHIHRVQHVVSRTVTKSAIMAACPGTLAKLQMLYMHTNPSTHTHGYGVQFVAASGNFVHINVPIYKGRSELMTLVGSIAERSAA